MKKALTKKISLDDCLDCYGNFNIKNPICKTFCALSLRCAVERDKNIKIDLLEDLIFSSGMLTKIQ